MMRGAAQLRAETVRAILAREPLDEETLPGRLGYDVRRTHVAMRVASGTSEIRGLERAAREAAAALAPGEPLIVPSGAASLDVWAGSYEPVDTRALERYEPPEGVRVAFGKPGRGLDGFRRSHHEAVQAARVAALAGSGGGAVVDYAQVELVSLLACDLPRAREFVASRLGPLAAPGRADPAAARDAARVPGHGRAERSRREGALRPSEHGRLPDQARGGAARPPRHRGPRRARSARWRSPTRSGRPCSRSTRRPRRPALCRVANSPGRALAGSPRRAARRDRTVVNHEARLLPCPRRRPARSRRRRRASSTSPPPTRRCTRRSPSCSRRGPAALRRMREIADSGAHRLPLAGVRLAPPVAAAQVLRHRPQLRRPRRGVRAAETPEHMTVFIKASSLRHRAVRPGRAAGRVSTSSTTRASWGS